MTTQAALLGEFAYSHPHIPIPARPACFKDRLRYVPIRARADTQVSATLRKLNTSQLMCLCFDMPSVLSVFSAFTLLVGRRKSIRPVKIEW